MNLSCKKFRSLFVGVFLLCAAISSAQTLVPGHSLRVIATEHFDIIFPEESRPGAEFLAAVAEQHLEEITSLLGIPWTERIPVTLSPFTDRFNGYMNSFPYSHIVLYDVPPDVEFVTYRNSLESLFVHELTHVVSLATRSSLFQKLNRIFGGWVMPAALSAPLFMVEGVTVSFESREGFGRANDPLVHHRLAQAVYEGRVLSPVQASGTWDRPPFSRAYYEYGGLFSSWLQKTFGMELYAKLWKELGTFPAVSLWYTHSGVYAAFEKVYQIPLLDAWREFTETFSISGVTENTGGIRTEGNYLIMSVAAAKGTVYFLERYTRRVYALSLDTGEIKPVVTVDAESESIALSSDGTRLFISGFRNRGALASSEVREYSVQTGEQTGRIWHGLTSAVEFQGGVVGLSHEGHVPHLVFCKSPNDRRILLSGNPELLFSAPVPLDSSRIAFIAAEHGKRSLWIYDNETGEVSTFSAGEELDQKIWPYIRGLSAGPNELLFSYHDGEGLYKLARITMNTDETFELILSDTNYSGGVFSPVRVENQILYRAQFSGSDALAVYPEHDSSSSMSRYPLSREPVSVNRYTLPGFSNSRLVDSSRFDEKTYSPLSWVNPFDFWFPVPLVRTSGSIVRLDGGGFLTYMGTPTDMNVFLLVAAYDARERMADLDMTWVSFSLGAPLTVRFTDGLEVFTDDSFRYPYRETRGSASLAFTRGIGGERIRYSVEPSFEVVWTALPRADTASAYEWSYEHGYAISGLRFSLMNRDQLPWELFGRGWSWTLSGKATLPDREFRWDSVFRASMGTSFPVSLTLYGARDESGMDLDGSSVISSSSPWDMAAAKEYAADDGGDHTWVTGAETAFCFFSMDIQKPLSHVYWNRFFGILAWRGVLYDHNITDGEHNSPGRTVASGISFANSLVLKFGAVVTLLPVPLLPIRFSPHGWIAWKLTEDTPLDVDKALTVGLSFQAEW